MIFVRPICNGRRDRAPTWGKYSFPLCWRCTAAIVAIFITAHITKGWGNFWGILLLIPCAIDGMRQYFFQKVESTNPKRILTGALLGIGLILFMNYMFSIL
jgi:uncharacterized membrane protein